MLIGAISPRDRINFRRPAWLGQLVARLRLWRRNAATRAALAELPPGRLRDLGLTEADAAQEARRPFWD